MDVVTAITASAYLITVISFFVKMGKNKGREQQKTIDIDFRLNKLEGKFDEFHKCFKNFMLKNTKDITEIKTLIKKNGNKRR